MNRVGSSLELLEFWGKFFILIKITSKVMQKKFLYAFFD